MLPQWPTAQRELHRFFERTVQAATAAHAPLLQRISHIRIEEGNRIEFMSPGGDCQTLIMEPHSASATIDIADFRDGGAQAIFEAATKLGASLATEMEKTLVQSLQAGPEGARRTFSGSTPRELGEEFAAALEDIEVDFDDDGSPSMVVIVHPETWAKLGPVEDPDLRAKVDAITARKRDEWISRESHRRLAD